MQDDPGYGTVKSAETQFRILDALMELETVSLSKIASKLDISKSTVHRHLKTLRNEDFVTVRDDEYTLGLRFLEFGEYVRSQWEIFEAARDQLDELVYDTGEKGWIMVEENDAAVYLYGAFGEHHVRTKRAVGTREGLHYLAGGKAMLANMDENRVQALLGDTDLFEITDHTVTDRSALLDELEIIRERGYALNLEELMEGMHAIGVPIRRKDGGVYGAISISGPANRLTVEKMEDEIAERLMGVAHEVELSLWYG